MGLTQEKPKTTFHPLYFLFAFIMWLLVIGWLAVIFSLSAESADVSTLRSQDLMEKIADLFHVTVNEEIVRNCAHIFEFTVLSVFTYIAMFATNHVKTGEKPSASGRLDKIKNDNEVYISVSLWITALSALEPGCSIGEHIHEGDSEIFIVERGCPTYNDSGTEVEAKPGDVLICPAETGHSIANHTGETVDIIALIVYA